MIPRRTFVGYLAGVCASVMSAVRARAWFKTPGRAHPLAEQQNLNSTNPIESAVESALGDGQFCWSIPSAFKPALRDRLVRAETDYSQGRMPGVQEQNISKAFNFLAERLGAPDYAFTSQLQVRILRMGGNDRNDSEISPEMGPAQAFYLVRSLVFRKLYLPDYQVPPKEWDDTYYPRMVENLRFNQKLREQPPKEPPKEALSGTLRAESRPTKYAELYGIVSRSISSLSFDQGMSLIDEASRIMGLPGSFAPWQKSV